MSISAVSSIGIQQNTQNTVPSIATTLQQLASALQSGNLASAQQAYNAAQSSLTSTTTSTSISGISGQAASNGSVLQQGLSQVGSALQSGNLSAASSALNTLQQNLQANTPSQSAPNAKVHHHHGGVNKSPINPATSTSATAASSTSASSSVPGTTINVRV